MSLFSLRCTRLCASCQKEKLIELCWNHQSEEETVLLLEIITPKSLLCCVEDILHFQHHSLTKD